MQKLFSTILFLTACLLTQAQVEEAVKDLGNNVEAVDEEVVIKRDTSGNNNKKEIFYIVEVAPEYPGGQDSLMSFLVHNVHYPEEARKANIQGTVYVSFVVEADGKVSNIKVLRGVGGGCDEEAMRVVGLMPNWKPGLQRGKPVRVQFNLPLRFILTGDNCEDQKKNK